MGGGGGGRRVGAFLRTRTQTEANTHSYTGGCTTHRVLSSLLRLHTSVCFSLPSSFGVPINPSQWLFSAGLAGAEGDLLLRSSVRRYCLCCCCCCGGGGGGEGGAQLLRISMKVGGWRGGQHAAVQQIHSLTWATGLPGHRPEPQRTRETREGDGERERESSTSRH